MQTYNIATGTITYAIKGRDVLRNAGFKAHIERRKGSVKTLGCGYSIIVAGDIGKIEEILRSQGIKVLSLERE